jgi:hypothetical protein
MRDPHKGVALPRFTRQQLIFALLLACAIAALAAYRLRFLF